MIGGIPWVLCYSIQRSESPAAAIVRPPHWVVLLCANPRRDGTLDLKYGSLQLTGFIPCIVGPVVILLGIDFDLRVAIIAVPWFLATLVVLGLVGWVSWKEGRRKRN
jgi:hypothetical protein